MLVAQDSVPFAAPPNEENTTSVGGAGSWTVTVTGAGDGAGEGDGSGVGLGAGTVSVKDCVAFGSVPFAAATVKGKLPDPDGVPESTHETESVTPAGREPDVEQVGAGAGDFGNSPGSINESPQVTTR